jgi:acyl-CoA thioester hydrolase
MQMQVSRLLERRGLELCCTLRPSEEMIDYNGHLNIGCYGILFEEAARSILPRFDLSQAYRDRTGHTLFASELHVVFRREVFEGEAINVYLRLVDATDRAIHAIYLMVKGSDGELAASQEILYLHVDLVARAVAPMDDLTVTTLANLTAKQNAYPLPIEVGRRIQLRKPSAKA